MSAFFLSRAFSEFVYKREYAPRFQTHAPGVLLLLLLLPVPTTTATAHMDSFILEGECKQTLDTLVF